MSEVRSLIKSIVQSRRGLSPKDILTYVNSGMYPDLSKLEFIITLIYMRVDVNNKKIVYANAGQNPPIICDRTGGSRELTGGDPLMGIFEEYNFSEFTIDIHGDESLLVYTDGLTETQNTEGEFFGIENLKSTLCGVLFRDPAELKSYILDTLIEFRGSKNQTDDITMVVINFD
jgi:sigma-B regulation protein RsbU (phosphoserine phosphatase)